MPHTPDITPRYDDREEALRHLLLQLTTFANLLSPSAVLEGEAREALADMLRLIIQESSHRLLGVALLTVCL